MQSPIYHFHFSRQVLKKMVPFSFIAFSRVRGLPEGWASAEWSVTNEKFNHFVIFLIMGPSLNPKADLEVAST